MRFRLTYEGKLEANGTAKHKHEIRKDFHAQLKRLWEVEPNLKNWTFPYDQKTNLPRVSPLRNQVPAWRYLAEQYSRIGYKFVPVVSAEHSLHVALDILFLRPDVPGGVLKSGDIDNRLKTLFDALKMPQAADELGGYIAPAAEEDPFYVLLEDDRLISHVGVETDVLLQPTPTAAGNFLPNDARLIITATIRPYAVHMQNLHFA